MIYRNKRPTILRELGSRNQLLQNYKFDLESEAKIIGVELQRQLAVRRIAEIILKYEGKEAELLKNTTDVLELQCNLVFLKKYDLGNSGVNNDGVDGILGKKCNNALTHFKKDYENNIKWVKEGIDPTYDNTKFYETAFGKRIH